MRHIYLILFLFFSFFLVAEEGVEIPDPGALRPDWWNYFDVPVEKLSERVPPFIADLEKRATEITPQNKDRVNASVELIRSKLSSLIQVRSQEIPPPPKPAPIAEKYTLDQLIELNREFRKLGFQLKTKSDELNVLNTSIQNEQERLDRLTQSYTAAEARTEEKLLLGFEGIATRISIAVSNRKLELTRATIENMKQRLGHDKEELEVAKTRLVSDSRDLSRYARQVLPANEVWKSARLQYRAAETALPPEDPNETPVESEVKQGQYVQKVVKAGVEETLAQLELIQAQVRYQLTRLILEPEEVDTKLLNESIREWRGDFNVFRDKAKLWNDQVQKQIQRSSQLLTTETSELGATIRPELETWLDQAETNLLSLQRLNNERDDTSFLLGILSNTTNKQIGGGEFLIRESLNILWNIITKGWEFLGKTIFTIGNKPVTLWGILRFIAIIIATIYISDVTLNALTNIIRRRKGIRKSIVYRVNRLIHYFILFLGLIIALMSLGFDFSNLVLVAGALGVGIGFGLQAIFNNFISGIIILFQSHLKVGDYVELDSGLRGEIREINVRSTVITTNDGVDVLIPNSELISNKVTNWTLREPYRRVRVPFGVAYGTDKELVRDIVLKAAKEVPITLEKVGVPEPSVQLIKFGDNALEFELVVWVNERATRRTKNTQSAYLWAIETKFREHNISIPFPQRDLHIIKPENKNKNQEDDKGDSSPI